MNIFVLDLDFEKNVSYYVDKHVSKMVLETAQLLCFAHHKLGTDPKIIPYKSSKSHLNHPCSKWVSQSFSNYLWLVKLGIHIGKEFEYRRGKSHKSSEVIKWASNNYPKIIDKGLTTFALAMPEVYRGKDPVESYRNYYVGDKKHIFQWTKREIPEWIKRRSL